MTLLVASVVYVRRTVGNVTVSLTWTVEGAITALQVPMALDPRDVRSVTAAAKGHWTTFAINRQVCYWTFFNFYLD